MPEHGWITIPEHPWITLHGNSRITIPGLLTIPAGQSLRT